MKKLLFIGMIATSLISSAFAAPVKGVNRTITTAFQISYPEAGKVQWTLTSDYAKASFDINAVKTEAFYNLNGDFIGSGHTISINNLPTEAKRKFAKKYAAYTVREAIQFNGVDESAFYISAENEKETVILKVTSNSIERFKTSFKN